MFSIALCFLRVLPSGKLFMVGRYASQSARWNGIRLLRHFTPARDACYADLYFQGCSYFFFLLPVDWPFGNLSSAMTHGALTLAKLHDRSHKTHWSTVPTSPTTYDERSATDRSNHVSSKNPPSRHPCRPYHASASPIGAYSAPIFQCSLHLLP